MAKTPRRRRQCAKLLPSKKREEILPRRVVRPNGAGAAREDDARALARSTSIVRSFVPPVVRSFSLLDAAVADAKARVSFADEENIGRRVRSVRSELCVAYSTHTHSTVDTPLTVGAPSVLVYKPPS